MKRTGRLFTVLSLIVLLALLVAWVPAASALTLTQTMAATRIQFARGGTSDEVQGQLAAGGSQTYVLRLLRSQLLEVNVFPEQGINLTIRGANGTVVKPTGLPPFRGYVPRTQDYFVTLTAGSTAESFTLQIIIPARISFARGGTSATVHGVLPPQTSGHYILRASAGQTLNVVINATQGQAILVIYGVDGNVLISDHAGATSFTGTLPTTEDYLIDVESVGSQTAVFSMKVTIPPLTPPPSSAKRIAFAPGQTSAMVQGQLAAGGSQTYVLHVFDRQLLEVSVFPEQGIDLAIRGANGVVIKPAGLPPFRGYVPSTQDYFVTLTATNGAVSYTLQVIVPERISFATGGTSATVEGVLQPQTTGHYILRAFAGQTLNVTTHASQGQVILVIFGVDGDVLISDHAGATSFSGTLPTTQDYLIDVESVGSQPAIFSMKVTIPPM